MPVLGPALQINLEKGRRSGQHAAGRVACFLWLGHWGPESRENCLCSGFGLAKRLLLCAFTVVASSEASR